MGGEGTGRPGGEEGEEALPTAATTTTTTNDDSGGADYFQGGSSGGGKPSPILEPEQASFYIVRAGTQKDLAISTAQREWYVERKHAEKLNNSYKDDENKSWSSSRSVTPI